MEKLGWHSLGAAFDCACGVRHTLPIEACHVGPDAAEALVAFAKTRCGASCLAVADENTHEAGGRRLLSRLLNGRVHVEEHVYPGADLEATQEMADEVAALGIHADFYVGIGSGTLCDLVKSAGSVQKKPVLLFPTAASMNGYTSAIVALKVRGLKRTLPCAPATGIFADPEVVATAPQRMVAAGVADFLSKCSSAADWRTAHLLRGDYFCARPREFNEGIQEKLFAQAEAIGRGELEAVKLVLEALLLSGFGMVVAGSSAPASGGEHLLSHYLDMKHAIYGTGNDLHGTQVGVGTVYTLGLWERVLSLEADRLDVDALVARHPSQEEIHAWVIEDWGQEVGAEVWDQWNKKRLDSDGLRAEILRFKEQLPKLRELLPRDLQPAKTVAECIRACGGPVVPEDMHAPAAEFEKAKQHARYLRNRFTILDLAAELGVA